jgi:hypothetical protein
MIDEWPRITRRYTAAAEGAMNAGFSLPSGSIRQNGRMRRIQPGRLRCVLLAGSVALAAPVARAEAPTVMTFGQARIGTLPPGFRTFSSAEGEPGRWQVVRVEGIAALGQTDEGRAGYRLAVLEAIRLDDLRLGTRLRMGRGDRAGGLAWRVRDAANYYAARLDLASREFVVYKFVRGNRVRLSRLSGLRLDAAGWHDMAVEHVGTRIKVWLNGIPVASERDDALPEAGMAGVWVPGDSTAHFARLWYERASKD